MCRKQTDGRTKNKSRIRRSGLVSLVDSLRDTKHTEKDTRKRIRPIKRVRAFSPRMACCSSMRAHSYEHASRILSLFSNRIDRLRDEQRAHIHTHTTCQRNFIHRFMVFSHVCVVVVGAIRCGFGRRFRAQANTN